jgi:choline/glycine/proline betaine transport protein
MNTSSKALNKSVFIPASLIIAALLLLTIIKPDYSNHLFNALQNYLVNNASWFYILVVAVILGFILYLSLSRFGAIKLGPEHSTPDYSLSEWIAMLFAAGMGIGLMFFGVAEPIMHYLSPPTAEPNSMEAIKEAMKITFFHWGLHAWAIYAIVALILAFFSYRYQLPLTLRSALHPIIGDKIYGWPGHLVDIFAVVSTVFGVATSLGLGASQVNSGLNYLIDIDVSVLNQVIIMLAITVLASVSVVTGLDKGIKFLSESNMVLAIALLLLIFILGPSIFLLQAYIQNIGHYLSEIVSDTFNLFAYDKKDWIGGWTLFYWGWWLAWAPFVGLFIARISRGRTIREFVIGVMVVPTAFTLLWMTIFGNSAIYMAVEQGYVEITNMVSNDSSVALFVFLEKFPWSGLLTGLSVLMIVIFFVTSCDSGAMVINMLCSYGEDNTPIWQRLFWAFGVGIVAAVLSLAGGLSALQTMTIASAFPFSIVLLISCFGLIKALQVESAKMESLQRNVATSNQYNNTQDWREKLNTMVSTPDKKDTDKFINTVVKRAFKALKNQFDLNDIETAIVFKNSGLILKVLHGDEHDFIYGVHKKECVQPSFNTDDAENYYQAVVHLLEGGQDYDIMGWTEESVINDVLEQYLKHMHFLHLLRDEAVTSNN